MPTTTINYNRMSERLRMLMARDGWNDLELSRVVGCSDVSIGRLRRGQIGKAVSLEIVWNVARALGITVDQLIGDAPLDYESDGKQLNQDIIETQQTIRYANDSILPGRFVPAAAAR